MIAKKNQYVLKLYVEEDAKEGLIQLPDKRKQNSNFFIVMGKGISNEIDIPVGSLVVCGNISGNIDSVYFRVGFEEYTLLPEKDIFALAVENFVEVEDKGQFEVKMEKVHGISATALNKRVVIAKDRIEKFTKQGDLFIPYQGRELLRAHHGVIVSVGEEAEKEAGLKPGMVVSYDYAAAYGHEHGDYDVVDYQNVIGILSDVECEEMQRKGLCDAE